MSRADLGPVAGLTILVWVLAIGLALGYWKSTSSLNDQLGRVDPTPCEQELRIERAALGRCAMELVLCEDRLQHRVRYRY